MRDLDYLIEGKMDGIITENPLDKQMK